MDELDVALLIYLEDEQPSEEESNRSEENELFKNRSSEGAFEILVRRHLHYNEEKLRQYFRLTPVLFDYVLNTTYGMNYHRNRTIGTKSQHAPKKSYSFL
ncbi:hypothetical protein TNCT_460491 [Trichonephila clavata]|uniref:Uncharacterized protein n=1 Tax=Trichonephila clavata TaxID=2740835 RepID=A0A8X6LPC9_TRICU|nr:hypothetical protein TNCT_460491 [Trichonephila clavata]